MSTISDDVGEGALTRVERRPAQLRWYWLGLLGCAAVWGVYFLIVRELRTKTWERADVAPLYAWIRRQHPPRFWYYLFCLPPIAVFVTWVWTVRRLSGRWVGCLVGVGVVFAMNVVMAMAYDGVGSIAAPFNRPGFEYYYDVPWVASLGVKGFLREYAGLVYDLKLGLHARTHPPGGVLVLYFISRLLGSSLPTAAWGAIAITATGVIPAYLLARAVGGRRVGRVVLAMYPVAPSLVLFGATSMDGVYLVPLLWSIYLGYLAVRDGGAGRAILAGAALAVSVMLTYATVCVGVFLGIYAVLTAMAGGKWKSAARTAAIAGGVVLASQLALWWTCGFNILAALQWGVRSDHMIMQTDRMTVGQYFDISVDNLLAFLVGAGLATTMLCVMQAGRMVRRARWGDAERVNAALLGTIGMMSFSRLFTHETERVWVFLMPVALIMAGRWVVTRGRGGRLLEWAMVALFLQTFVFQVWLWVMW